MVSPQWRKTLIGMKKDQIPTEKDWAGYENDMDAAYAHKIFFGKSNDQVQDEFKRCVIERVSELRFMPKAPFQYYVLGLRDHVMNRDFDDAWDKGSDAASCFLKLVLQKLKEQPAYILPVIQELMPAVEFVAKNQTIYEADPQIYGDFGEILNEIRELGGIAN